MTTEILRLRGVTKKYGHLIAVDDVNLDVEHGARHAIIGPNGAGKSTLFAILAGALPPTAGSLWLDGTEITGAPEHRHAAAGIVRTFQHSSLFRSATVLENVAIAAQRAAGVAHHPLRNLRHIAEVNAVAAETLERVGLAHRSAVAVDSLSHGEQRQVEVALALACRPRVLLFDEPTAGMSPAETDRFAGIIDALAADITVVFIEHDIDLVFRLATHVTVLHLGRKLADGDPSLVRSDPRVQEAYLGTSDLGHLFTDLENQT